MALRPLGLLDALCNRLYGWKHNPLYHAGALAVAMLAVILLTGLYLIFFYKLSAPWESIQRIEEQVLLGRWIRALHRYASDVAVVAVAVHAFRMFAQDRAWGPRALAWVSGLLLLLVVLVCGWTGYVMVWDVQGLVLAREGARLLDVLPLFSEPIGRAFGGERALPSAFFFLNLFLHVALPIGIGLMLWVHTARVARPVLLPPRSILWTVTGLLLALSLAVPAALGPAANPLRLAGRAPYDWFFSFWVPFAAAVPAGISWTVVLVVSAIVFSAPWWTRPRARRPEPSVVDERLCTGCRQCYLDCPYEAISMLPRDVGQNDEVAHVDPALCVSCGICTGSCAPMGVGPAGRTGRDQLVAVRAFVARHPVAARDVVLVGCARGAGGLAAAGVVEGAPLVPIDCVGNLHTSMVEYLVRAGSAVLIVGCPPRDCWNREGTKWLEQRLFHDREAELQPRVDRRRVRLTHAAHGEPRLVRAALATFRADLAGLETPDAEVHIAIDTTCDPVPDPVEVP